jgi:folate-dependent phosphoribosylglycinamide formyltransferase PurN
MTEAGTYEKEVAVNGAETSKATVAVPADAEGKSIHVVCEVVDEGVPALVGYRRVIVEVGGK